MHQLGIARASRAKTKSQSSLVLVAVMIHFRDVLRIAMEQRGISSMAGTTDTAPWPHSECYAPVYTQCPNCGMLHQLPIKNGYLARPAYWSSSVRAMRRVLHAPRAAVTPQTESSPQLCDIAQAPIDTAANGGIGLSLGYQPEHAPATFQKRPLAARHQAPGPPRRGCSGGVEAEPASISGPTLGTRTTGVDHLREGSMSKALAKENVKQPRGSKLDAKKRGQCSLRDLLGIVSEISDL